MLTLPLHPRQARIVVEGERRGVAREACGVAAILGEGGLERARGPAQVSGPADVLADLDIIGGTQADRVRKQLLRSVATGNRLHGDASEALQRCILAGYPDRIARRRKPKGSELVLSGGGTARLAESSVVRDAELMVAVDAEERGEKGRVGQVTVRSACAISADWLLDDHPDRLRESTTYVWNGDGARVDVVRKLSYDQLTLDESRAPARSDDQAASRVLCEALRERGARTLVDGEALDRLLGRVAFVRVHAPELELPEVDLDRALEELCRGKTRVDEIADGELFVALLAPLDGKQRRALDELAPERVTLARGRAVRVDYPPGQPPQIASRLQDFFGMRAGPTVARGRVALTLHLLAPNQRAVQVTSDLAGFWERHYPSIRRELCRRYPKHSWPEDPRM
jgi:ATP-dependent helicase HrpB